MKILSRDYIEHIAKRILKVYYQLPEFQGRKVYSIDPEIVIRKVLGLEIEYAHLSLNGNILGMTSFNDIDVEVYEQDDQDKFVNLDGNKILVERDLKNDISQLGRYNFTVMHEGSHQAFKMLFPKEYGAEGQNQKILFYTVESERNPFDRNWVEWQANTLASAILLPEDLIKHGMYLLDIGEKIECLNRVFKYDVYEKFTMLANFLGVSKQALAIRMKQLGLIDKEYLKDPYSLIEVVKES